MHNTSIIKIITDVTYIWVVFMNTLQMSILFRNIMPQNGFYYYYQLVINMLLCFLCSVQQQIVRMLRKHRSLGHQKEMLRNLDILAYEQYSSQALKCPPSLEKTTLEVETTYMRDSYNNQYPLLCELSQFRKYGPGVYLPFRFLKQLLVAMGVLLPLPATILLVMVLSQDHFVGHNMQTTLQATTLQNITPSNQTLVISLNFVVLLVLTLSILYWQCIQTDQILSCTSKTCLSSYYTAILSKIPDCYSEHDLVQFLEKNYGKVHSIYTVKNYQDDLVNYEEIEQILQNYKTQRQIFLRSRGRNGCLELLECFLAYKQKHSEIVENIVKNKTYQPILAFVTFHSVEARNSLLQDLGVKFNRFGSKTSKQVQLGDQFLYKNQRLQFRSCQLEPNGIIWQNINVPIKEKLLRCSLILCLLVAFLFVSITIFFILGAAQSSLYSDQYDEYTEQEILQLNNPEAIKCYCIDLSYSKFKSKPFCQPYLRDYIDYFILYLVFPFFVTFLKGCFTIFMKKLVVLRRHKYQFYKIKWEIAIVTLFYFIKAGLIKWFIYRKFAFGNTHIKLLDIFLPFLNEMAQFVPIQPEHIHLYENFNKKWVAHASHKTILIAMVSFNFSILFFYVTGVLKRKYRQKSAASQPTTNKMKEMLKGQQFDFEFFYAELLALFLFCMLYFSCIPIIYLLVFISLLLLYWVAKYSLLRLCQVPPIYSHSIHDMAVKIILVGLMMNSLVSPIYYGNIDEAGPQSCFSCWVTYWYYPLNFVLILLSVTCKVQIIRAYYFVKNKIMDLFEDGLHEEQYQRRINAITSEPQGLKSYSMHSCEKYSEVLKILFAINRNEFEQLGCFTQEDIVEIKKIVDQPNNQFKLFTEMYSFLQAYIQKNSKQSACSEDYSHNKEKYEKFKEELQNIKKQVEIEIAQEIKLVQLHSIFNSKLLELNKSALVMDKLQSALKKSSNLENPSKAEQLQDCMDTDVRIA